MYWPVAEDGDLVRQVSLGESDAIPNDEDVARWIVDGMRRDGLTAAAAVRVVRQ